VIARRRRLLAPRTTQLFASAALWGMMAGAIAILIAILIFVLGRGLPHVGWTFLTHAPLESGRAGGVMPILAGTLEVTGLGIAAAAPLASERPSISSSTPTTAR